MKVEGIYDVSGQVLLLPIKGTGKFIGNFSEFLFLFSEVMSNGLKNVA